MQNVNAGDAMLAYGESTLTLEIKLATNGNSSWTAGSIRLREGYGDKELHFVKFADGNMLSACGKI